MNCKIDETFFCQVCDTNLTEEFNCLKCKKVQIEFNIFSFVSIVDQLKSLVNSNFDKITSLAKEKRNCVDLLDGEYYSKIKKENTLHLMIVSDGVRLANSSIAEFWPVFVSLVELPRHLRESKANKMIAGLWCANKKPSSDILFSNLKFDFLLFAFANKRALFFWD